MAEEIKLPEDLMLEIQKLRDELTQNVVRIGRLNVQASFYRKDLEIIEADLKNLYEMAERISIDEEKLQGKVVEKYGTGKLDFESGIFYKD
jgi:hypothetical protein